MAGILAREGVWPGLGSRWELCLGLTASRQNNQFHHFPLSISNSVTTNHSSLSTFFSCLCLFHHIFSFLFTLRLPPSFLQIFPEPAYLSLLARTCAQPRSHHTAARRTCAKPSEGWTRSEGPPAGVLHLVMILNAEQRFNHRQRYRVFCVPARCWLLPWKVMKNVNDESATKLPTLVD